jgi:hypothetical protein
MGKFSERDLVVYDREIAIILNLSVTEGWISYEIHSSLYGVKVVCETDLSIFLFDD